MRTLRTDGVLRKIELVTSRSKPSRRPKYSTMVSFSPRRAPFSLVIWRDFSRTVSGQRTIQGMSFLPRTSRARAIRSATTAGEYLKAHRSARTSSRSMWAMNWSRFCMKLSFGTRNMNMRRENWAATLAGSMPARSAKW
uniref:(northern house mosquito) hypothetical protein n=1 Tax=Culex pipiens TaxID=7175 RepID=A0A8D8DYX2_CULPI